MKMPDAYLCEELTDSEGNVYQCSFAMGDAQAMKDDGVNLWSAFGSICSQEPDPYIIQKCLVQIVKTKNGEVLSASQKNQLVDNWIIEFGLTELVILCQEMMTRVFLSRTAKMNAELTTVRNRMIKSLMPTFRWKNFGVVGLCLAAISMISAISGCAIFWTYVKHML